MNTSPRRPARGRALVAALAAACAIPLLPAAPAAAGPVGDGADGIGDAYYPLDGNGGYDVDRYVVRDRYRFGSGRLTGTTVVVLDTTEDLSSFHLDLMLPAKRVTVDGVRAAHSRPHRHELEVRPAEPLAAGTRHRVRVTYAGRPGRAAYVQDVEHGSPWTATRREVAAVNQPHIAPWWFPANDHPRDRARMDVRITVPRGREVIANGTPRGVRRHGRLVTSRWVSEEPMAPYLAFFVAGDFTLRSGRSAQGLRWWNAVSERLGPGERRRALRRVGHSARIVHGLERDLGPYPFSSTGGVVISAPLGFALENQTRPVYEPHSTDTDTIVHELAHQWFGDHVTVDRWRDIWLNEGFATFMEWRWDETHGGRAARATLRNIYDGYAEGARFWDLAIADPGSSRIFDTPVYVRGAMTLQALRRRIGDDAYWTLLRSWADQQGGGTARSEEFEALAEQVSGQDLAGFFDTWLRTGAKPADTAANGLG